MASLCALRRKDFDSVQQRAETVKEEPVRKLCQMRMWNSGAQVKTFKGSNYWSVEIQVQAGGAVARDLDSMHQVAGDMPTKDFPWYFNMCRLRPRGNKITRASAYIPTFKKKFNNRYLRGAMYVE